MRAPDFWQQRGAASTALLPAGALFDAAGRLRRRLAHPVDAGIPVICIGNLVAGGAGKTPLTLALAEDLMRRGLAVRILSRGYGGTLVGPIRVDPDRCGFRDTGDEPLLLARAAPCIVARDRPAGAALAVESGGQILLMDDGLQNPSLVQDLRLIAIDGGYGFGNGRVMPAGPLRESLDAGLARVQGAVLIGEDRFSLADRLGRRLPLARARLVPTGDAARWAGRRVLAFAGIGRPQKFFDTLAGLGAQLVATRSFADHHPFTAVEIADLLDAAAAQGATAITTAKDRLRLPPGSRDRIETLDIALAWTSEADRRIVEQLILPLLPKP
ncbi:MAG: tetraacyldisaccharide 4'-kinase [Aliidongia sp.]